MISIHIQKKTVLAKINLFRVQYNIWDENLEINVFFERRIGFLD